MGSLEEYLVDVCLLREMKLNADAMGTMTCGGMWVESRGGDLPGNEGPLVPPRLNRKQRRAMKARAR